MGKKQKKQPKESEDKPKKQALTQEGALSRRFKEVLVEIFRRFDQDADGVLCDEELQAFSRVANKDGREFTDAELSEMKSMFHWKSEEASETSGLTLRGFVQLYERQTAISEEETWSDLTRLGYNSLLQSEAPAHPPQDGVEGEAEGDAPRSQLEHLEAELKVFHSSPDKLMVCLSADAEQICTVSKLATAMGLECRMLLADSSDIPSLHIFKRPEPLQDSLRCASPSAGSGKGSAVFAGLELDADCCKQLLDAFGDFVPAGWQVFAHHMTICLGTLADARANSAEVSGDLQESIRQLRPGERLALEPVSIGEADGVVALGVIGCPSVNRTPHITLACAKGHRPVESNKISKWHALPPERLIQFSGRVKEYQQAEVSAGLTAAGTQDRQDLLRRLEVLEAEVLAARAICMKELLESDDAAVRRAIDERERELACLTKLGEQDEKWQAAKPVKGKQGKERLCFRIRCGAELLSFVPVSFILMLKDYAIACSMTKARFCLGSFVHARSVLCSRLVGFSNRSIVDWKHSAWCRTFSLSRSALKWSSRPPRLGLLASMQKIFRVSCFSLRIGVMPTAPESCPGRSSKVPWRRSGRGRRDFASCHPLV